MEIATAGQLLSSILSTLDLRRGLEKQSRPLWPGVGGATSPGKAPPTACGVPLEKPTRVSHVRNEKASTFVVHAMLLELAEAPGLGWRRRGISLAQLWRAAVADARPAIAELAKRKISSVGHLFDVAQRVRGVHNLVSLAHVKVAKRVESMLRHLDDMLRSRAKGDLALERRRRLYANG